MTFLIQIDSQGEPINHPVDDGNFRALFPSTSFPLILTPQSVQGTGFAMYEFSQQPELGRYEKLIEGTPKKAADGRFFQTWQVVEMNDDEKVELNNEQAVLVRSQRTMKLRATDWVFNPDAPLNEEQRQAYVVYRQELRDISAQEGFPWDITWPQAPQ